MQIEKLQRLSYYDYLCIDQAIPYIGAHYNEKINSDQLAMELNISKDKLQSGIKKKTGLTLHGYVLKVRIENAKSLLLTSNDPVKFICGRTGFKDQSHFIRVFKKLAYITPAEYRFQDIESLARYHSKNEG